MRRWGWRGGRNITTTAGAALHRLRARGRQGKKGGRTDDTTVFSLFFFFWLRTVCCCHYLFFWLENGGRARRDKRARKKRLCARESPPRFTLSPLCLVLAISFFFRFHRLSLFFFFLPSPHSFQSPDRAGRMHVRRGKNGEGRRIKGDFLRSHRGPHKTDAQM